MNRINEKIEAFYINDNLHNSNKYLPMFYDSPTDKHLVLSIGLNPSLTQDACNFLDKKELWLEHFFQSDESARRLKIQEVINYQKTLKSGKEKIQYFKLLDAFFKEIGYPNFTESVFHYDLYQKRITNSEDVKKDFSQNKQLVPELIHQLELVIEELQPRIIFVFNATVAKILKQKNFFLSNDLDEEFGCHFKNNTPVILANQLSGGATSAIFRDMLIWKTKRIMKQLEK